MATNHLTPRNIGIGLLAAVAGLAFWLRAGQSCESLWLDELHTAWVVAAGVEGLVPRSAAGNQSPLYFAIVWAVTRVAGFTEFGLRLPSILAGTALAVCVCLLVVRWTHCWSAGVLASALVAVDRHCVFYAQEARTYALVQLVGLLHVLAFSCLVQRPRLALRAAWIASGALLFYLHYTAALLIVAEFTSYGLWRSLRRLARRDAPQYAWKQLAADAACLGVCLLPAVPHLREIAQRRQDWGAFVPARAWWRIWEIADMFPVFEYVGLPLAILAVAWSSKVFLRRQTAAAAAVSAQDDDNRWYEVLLIACWFVVPLGIAWAVTAQGSTPLFFRRYLMVAAVAPMLAAALCCAACPSAFWRGVLIAAVVGLSLDRGGMIAQWQRDGRVVGDRNQDWRAAVQYVRRETRPDVPVFVRSGLIEAERWYASSAALHREYCLLPVLGLYRLDQSPEALFPLPVRPAAFLSAAARQRIAACGQAWCILQGNEPSVARFEQALRSVWRQAGATPDSVERVSFGQVTVLHVTIADRGGQRPGGYGAGLASCGFGGVFLLPAGMNLSATELIQ